MAEYRENAPTKGAMLKVLQFSLPLIGSGILQQLYNWADAFIVGNVEGELALAAVGSTSNVTVFFITIINGFVLGLSVLFAQLFGKQAFAAISKLLSTFSVLLGAVFLLLSAAGMGMTLPFLQLMRTPQDILLLGEGYLKILFAGIPFLAVYNVYSAALRGIGDSRAPFYSVLLSSAVNILLDILFVAAFHWGVAGAAAATVLSQAAMTIFLVIYSFRKYSIFRFRIGPGVFDRSMLHRGCLFGFPPMIQYSVSSVGGLVLQTFMNGFGTQTVAAVTTAYRVDSIILVPIINLGSGISTLVGQEFGAGERSRAQKILRAGTIAMAIVSLLLTALVIPTGGYFIALFGAGQEAIAIGGGFLQRLACFYLIFGLATAIRSYLEGLGDVVFSSIAGIAGLALRIFLSYGMVSLFGSMVIAYAEAFSWIFLLLLCLLRILWRERRLKRESPVPLHTGRRPF